MAIKVQINSLEALERLIGGDSEIEIEIRNNIVQEFTRKHLKALANEQLGQAKTIITEAIREEMELHAGSYKYYGMSGKTFVLKPEIREAVQREVEQIVRDAVHECKSTLNLEQMVADQVNRASTILSRNLVNEEVRRRLDEISKQIRQGQ